MVKVDWNVFKVKFSENTQYAFEWFCYLLFCEEYGKPLGIFRYKNQSGIETNPIEKDEDVIGWQSKFYDTKLSDHKNDFIETLEISHRDYPELTKLIIYTNQEWGQGRKENDSQVKRDVDNKASELAITIDWRTSSYFESPFVAVQNRLISKHFFCLENGITSLLEEKKNHTERLFSQIHNRIKYCEHYIKLDRTHILDQIDIDFEKEQVSILHGHGGIGKTAIIKDLYEQKREAIPFYMFKAREFNIESLDLMFPNSNANEFIIAHKDEDRKIIVIDSAEALLEIELHTITEFLTVFIKNGWSLILTTRDYYLDDLNYLFIDIFEITPRNKLIVGLSQEELEVISTKYNFVLPSELRLIELIRIPFYLNEFLKYYDIKEALDYNSFKNKLWNRIIKKAKPNREHFFIELSVKKATSRSFFIKPDSNDYLIEDFAKDGILGSETAGFFITHDIYEEWALEKFINSEFIQRQDNYAFFNKIGDSLAIRRSFRKWLSDQLLLLNKEIMVFVEDVVQSEIIKPIWKDQTLISIFLSDSSEYFFEVFNSELLSQDLKLLRKSILLLRLACKEIDIDFLKQIGIENTDILRIKYLFTKPKGSGWKNLIKFYYDNIGKITHEKSHLILPLLYDWNNTFKSGETTRYASLLALSYYKHLQDKGDFYSNDDSSRMILQTILYGAYEIKPELANVFENVIENCWTNYRQPYNHLVRRILSEPMDCKEVISFLPEYVIQLADLYWSWVPSAERYPYYTSFGIEKHFGMNDNHSDYSPPSAYQTPTYWLLRSSFKSTIDFIIEFTNKTVESYAKSELAQNELSEVELVFENKAHKQYASDRLWKLYRGPQAAPLVLESIHMALEKTLLEAADQIDHKALEAWLIYLLLKSKSSSISAIVTSIVLAHPDKFFDVAKVLFQTKEFIYFDTSRMSQDRNIKSFYGFGYGLIARERVYADERLATCKQKHRSQSLENLVLRYQFFRSSDVSDEEAEERQKIIWDILDKYYAQLPDKDAQTDADKTWRLYLARMDRRKMNPQTESKEEGIVIDYNPQIDDDLKQYSDEATRIPNFLKHTALNLWAYNKIKGNSDSKNYPQYDDPVVVLSELKEIIAELQEPNDTLFESHSKGILGNACSVLIKEYFDNITTDERAFCRDVALEVAESSFSENYQYQISDGVESTISVLPILLAEYPEYSETIKKILLFTLLNPGSIGAYCEIFDYSNTAITELWNTSYDDAQALLFGYIELKPKYEGIRKKLFTKGIYHNENAVIKQTIKNNKTILKRIYNNEMNPKAYGQLSHLDFGMLKDILKLIPLGSSDPVHKELVHEVVINFRPQLLSLKHLNPNDHAAKQGFLKKFSQLVLAAEENEINYYLAPILENFNNSEGMADLFVTIINAQDNMNKYDAFWFIWNLFYDKIIGLSDNGQHWYTKKVMRSYLFAECYWVREAPQWHTLKIKDKTFFKQISRDIGHLTGVFYSLIKLINGIGCDYLYDGVKWLSSNLSNHKELWTVKLEDNTIILLESVTKKYIRQNRDRIRKTIQLKDEVLVILNFLVEKESVVGYMLRENIL